MVTEFWEENFREKRKMWGDTPTNSAIITLDLFVREGVKNILIPGIGYGRNAKIFLEKDIKVTGIEISETAIELAKKFCGENIKIIHGSVCDMPYSDAKYDGIFCHALIHLLNEAERKKLIKNCYNQLSENGYMVFTMIAKSAHTYGKGKYIGKDTFEQHEGLQMYFYDEKSIASEFEKYGLLSISTIEENFPFHILICKKF